MASIASVTVTSYMVAKDLLWYCNEHIAVAKACPQLLSASQCRQPLYVQGGAPVLVLISCGKPTNIDYLKSRRQQSSRPALDEADITTVQGHSATVQ